MMKQIVSDNVINFNDLEIEIYEIGCQYARNIMKEILHEIDQQLAKERDKKLYRHKGKRKTTIKTIMGEVEFERIIYETVGNEGEKAYVFLLDQAIGLETFGKISTNLALKILEHASISSFRNSATNISSTTGQSISHGGVWNVVQSVGTKLKEVENDQADLMVNGHITGDKETKILFEEADGVWINMQGKDKPKSGRKSELKVAVAYDGWENKGKNRYHLRNKIAVAGFDDSKAFQRRKEGVIASVFNTDEIDIRILNGDGGSWIKAGLIDDTVHYQLDPFHLNRDIIQLVKNKKHRKKLMSYIHNQKISEALDYLQDLSKREEDEKEKQNLEKLFNYMANNKNGIIPYQKRGLDLPQPPQGVVYRNLGTMEHHICDIIALRMKHRKASWSKRGAENLSKILTLKTTNRLIERLKSISSIILPEAYTNEIQEVLSAAKAPRTDGNGWEYPRKGGMPFEGAFVSNGRQAIRNMLSFR